MLVRASALEIPAEKPYANDVLNRASSATTLTRLIETVNDPFVLAISSPWGTGKTTFLQMWKADLATKDFPVVYVNAWENDFSNDPLVTLLSEIGSQLETLKGDASTVERTKQRVEKLKNIGVKVLRRSVPAMLKLTTYGVLDVNDLTEEVIASVSEKIAQDALESFGQTKETIVEFRSELADLASDLGQMDHTPYRPLIVIIDELDRCRPTYAVEMLEVAKHLFNASGVVFVIAVDRGQLEHSVRQLYGTGMDAGGYLRRFLDLDYSLPKQETQDFVQTLILRIGLDPLFHEKKPQVESEVVRVFSALFDLFDFSLRVQEQCIVRFGVAARCSGHHFGQATSLFAFLICVREADRNLYNRIAVRSVSAIDVIVSITEQFAGDDTFWKDVVGERLEAELVYALSSSNTKVDLSSYEEIVNSGKGDIGLRDRAEQIVALVNALNYHIGTTRILEGTISQIEVASDFKP